MKHYILTHPSVSQSFSAVPPSPHVNLHFSLTPLFLSPPPRYPGLYYTPLNGTSLTTAPWGGRGVQALCVVFFSFFSFSHHPIPAPHPHLLGQRG